MVDLGIFPLLMEKQYQETGISAEKLAEYTGAESDLIGTNFLSFLSGYSWADMFDQF